MAAAEIREVEEGQRREGGEEGGREGERAYLEREGGREGEKEREKGGGREGGRGGGLTLSGVFLLRAQKVSQSRGMSRSITVWRRKSRLRTGLPGCLLSIAR
jgi:hypothetical protein